MFNALKIFLCIIFFHAYAPAMQSEDFVGARLKEFAERIAGHINVSEHGELFDEFCEEAARCDTNSSVVEWAACARLLDLDNITKLALDDEKFKSDVALFVRHINNWQNTIEKEVEFRHLALAGVSIPASLAAVLATTSCDPVLRVLIATQCLASCELLRERRSWFLIFFVAIFLFNETLYYACSEYA